MSRTFTIAGLVLLVGLTVAAYWPVFGAGFVWSDDENVTANPMLRDGEGLREIWMWGAASAVSGESVGVQDWREPVSGRGYFPAADTAFWLEHHAWGDRALGYHVTSLGLHVLAALLLWWLLVRLGMAGWAAYLVAALFAMHPMNVETVAWVSQQSNELAMVFGVLTVLCWVRWTGVDGAVGGSAIGRGILWMGMMVFFVLSLLAKPVAVGLPVVLVLIVWAKRGRIVQRDILGVIPLVVVAMGVGLLTMRLEGKNLELASTAQKDIPSLVIASKALGFYAWKLVFPAGLNFNYPRWEFVGPGNWLIGGLMLAAVGVLLSLRQTRAAGVAGSVYLLLVLPMLGLVGFFFQRYSYVADRYSYLAGVGVFALVGRCLAVVARRWPGVGKVVAVVGVLVIGMLGWLTFERSRAFRSDETLCRDALSKNPEAWMPAVVLAADLERNGKRASLGEAEAYLKRAMDAHPREPAVWRALASVQRAQGKMKDAQETLKGALVGSNDPQTNEMLADMLIQSIGEIAYGKALPMYEAAFKHSPQRASVAASLADIYVAQGRVEDARRVLETGMRLNPKSGGLHYRMAGLLMQGHDLVGAEAEYALAVRLEPENAAAQMSWGLVLLEMNRYPEAAERLKDAIVRYKEQLRQASRAVSEANTRSREEAERQLAQCHLNLGRALVRQGKVTPAMGEFEDAIAYDDRLLAAYYEAGVAIMATHEDKAEAFFREALRKDSDCHPVQVALAKLLATPRDPGRRNVLEAIVLLRQAVEGSQGQDVITLVGLGDLLVEVNKPGPASEAYEKALALRGAQGLEPVERELVLDRLHECYIKMAPPLAEDDVPKYKYVETDNTMQRLPQDFRKLKFAPLDLAHAPSEGWQESGR